MPCSLTTRALPNSINGAQNKRNAQTTLHSQQGQLHADIEYTQYITPCGKCIMRVVDKVADERETGVCRGVCVLITCADYDEA